MDYIKQRQKLLSVIKNVIKSLFHNAINNRKFQ